MGTKAGQHCLKGTWLPTMYGRAGMQDKHAWAAGCYHSILIGRVCRTMQACRDTCVDERKPEEPAKLSRPASVLRSRAAS